VTYHLHPTFNPKDITVSSYGIREGLLFEHMPKGLRDREIANRVDITASDMFERFRDTKLMMDICHPTTFMFVEIVREICTRTGLTFFTDEQVARFLENENHMGLPVPPGK
jgi:hypothetical protein